MTILSNQSHTSIEEFTKYIQTGLTEFFRCKTQELINQLLEEEIIATLEQALLDNQKTRRNGHYKRLINTEFGPIEVSVPRDRLNLFETKILQPYQRRTSSLDEKIRDYYFKGLTTNEISDLLFENEGLNISRESIRKAVNESLGDAEQFNTRPLTNCPVIYLDGTYVPFKRSTTNTSKVEKECCMVALGINEEGKREILGFYFTPNEGSHSWRDILQSLKNRGVNDPKLFVTDGLQGMPEAIKEVYPLAKLQTCLVHVARNIIRNARKSDAKEIADDFKKVYAEENDTIEKAEKALNEFVDKWSKSYPRYMKTLLQKENMFTYLEFPKEMRKAIYTSNTVESFNSKLKRETKKRIQFNSENNAFLCVTYICIDFNKKSRRASFLSDMSEEDKLKLGFTL